MEFPFPKYNISQSLLKDLFEYAVGNQCGLQFEARYLKGVKFPSSDVQKLGIWFEYQCTGALPRDGKIPEPETKKNGELTASYERMKIQADRFKKTIEKYNIKILETGRILQYKDKKGVLDALIEFQGRTAILDIKSSGLIGNRWDDMGWDPEVLKEKDKITLQPIFYKWLWRKLNGNDIPFYFLVFSNTNEYDCLFLEVVVDEERFQTQEFERMVESAYRIINQSIEKGFKPHPEVKRCAMCPDVLKNTCKHFTEIPILKKVYV